MAEECVGLWEPVVGVAVDLGEEVEEPVAASSVESVDASSWSVGPPARLGSQLRANYPEGTQAVANCPQDTQALHWDQPDLKLEYCPHHARNRDSQRSGRFLEQPAESDVWHA